MKTLFILLFLGLVVVTVPFSAQLPFYNSAENTLKKASDLETWQQQLRYYEQQLAEREQTVFGKLEAVQQQHQQGMQQAAEREEALRQALQQQQEQAKSQAFRTRLQQQQAEAQQREKALQRQLEEHQERAAYERLQQGMQLSTLQQQLQEAGGRSNQQKQQDVAYGYTEKAIPRETQKQSAGAVRSMQEQYTGALPTGNQPPTADRQLPTASADRQLPTASADRQLPTASADRQLPTASADRQLTTAPADRLLIVEAPTPIATIAPLESKIYTTINGIDHIETRAILPENLSVEQLEAVKQITDNGALIAQQRLGLEQYQIGGNSQVSRLQVLKAFVLWGLLLSIPSLLTLSWIVRKIVLGWRSWQQEKLVYKLKELESVERQIAITERQFDADHQR